MLHWLIPHERNSHSKTKGLEYLLQGSGHRTGTEVPVKKPFWCTDDLKVHKVILEMLPWSYSSVLLFVWFSFIMPGLLRESFYPCQSVKLPTETLWSLKIPILKMYSTPSKMPFPSGLAGTASLSVQPHSINALLLQVHVTHADIGIICL